MNALEQQRLLDIDDGGEACVVCGCTDNAACQGGCSWRQHDPALCSSCCGVPVTDFFPTAPNDELPGGWQRCPLQAGHDVPHVFWHQSVAAGEKRRRNGVKIIDQNGEVLAMLDAFGAVTPLGIRQMLGTASATAMMRRSAVT